MVSAPYCKHFISSTVCFLSQPTFVTLELLTAIGILQDLQGDCVGDVYLSLNTTSLKQLAALSLERYIAMKYAEIQQQCNLKSFGNRQIVCSCLIAFLQVILYLVDT